MQPAPQFPNAKINIGLKIVSRREDGYHHIESVFYPINLYDVLEWRPASKFSISVYNNEALRVPSMNNILERAWYSLHKDFGIPPCEFHLLKNIPIGSGLGGGSSDAAFFLKAANAFFHLGLSKEQMRVLSLQWGSDCPFFIENRPAFVSGRGEHLTRVPHFLKGYWFAVVFTQPVRTAEAFRWITPPEGEGLDGEDLVNRPVEQWKGFVVNDFEPVLFPRFPFLKKIKQALYRQGALFASLSGSGSVVYAIFNKKIESARLAGALPEDALLFTGMFG